MPFDVERTMSIVPTGPNIRRAIKSVNLMCFLLSDLTYSDLYGNQLGPSLQKIIDRATRLAAMAPGSSLKSGAFVSTDISSGLLSGLQAIQRIPNINGIYLGSLFIQKFASGTPEQLLVAEIQTMYRNSLNPNNEVELTHFCAPFCYRQEAGVSVLGAGIIYDFLREIGNKTMYNLYTEPKSGYSPSQKSTLSDAREKHYILHDFSDRPGIGLLFSRSTSAAASEREGVITSHPLGNGLVCDGNGQCITGQLLDWCNDANGSCSAASSP